jgi:hypothetical protein
MRVTNYSGPEEDAVRDAARAALRARALELRKKLAKTRVAREQLRLSSVIAAMEAEANKQAVNLSVVQSFGINVSQLGKYQSLYRPVFKGTQYVQYRPQGLPPITRFQQDKPVYVAISHTVVRPQGPRRPKRPIFIPAHVKITQIQPVVQGVPGFSNEQLLLLLKQRKAGVNLLKAERLALLAYLRLLRERAQILAELRKREQELLTQAAAGASSPSEVTAPNPYGISLDEALATGKAWLSDQQIQEIESVEDNLAEEAESKGEVDAEGEETGSGKGKLIKGAIALAALYGGYSLIRRS